MGTEIINTTTAAEVVALARELERRKKSARDIVVPAKEIGSFVSDDGKLRMSAPDGTGLGSLISFEWGPTALQQTMTKLNVPVEYGRRMFATYPDVFNFTVNRLAGDASGNWLLRTLDGRVRANLSDRYRVLDNHDLFFAAYDVAKGVEAEISRVSLSEDRFEMRLIVPSWREDIDYKSMGEAGHKWFGKGGSQFVPGAYVANSETGKGGLTVKPFLLDKVCNNGTILETALRTVHLGGQNEVGYLSQESVEADSRAIWLKVRDLVRAVFDREQFREVVERFRATGELRLKDPVAAVDTVVKDYGMSDDDRQAILNELISPSDNRDPGRTIFGLLSAVTARAKDYEDPERRSAIEAAAGQILMNDSKQRELVAVRSAKKGAR